MSRGLGRIERLILDALRNNMGALMYTEALTAVVAGTFPHKSDNPSAAASTRRALGSLQRKGLIWNMGRNSIGTVWHIRGDEDSAEHLVDMLADGWPRQERDRMTKLLGMLGSEHQGERDNAARQIEVLRRKIGKSWDELLS